MTMSATRADSVVDQVHLIPASGYFQFGTGRQVYWKIGEESQTIGAGLEDIQPLTDAERNAIVLPAFCSYDCVTGPSIESAPETPTLSNSIARHVINLCGWPSLSQRSTGACCLSSGSIARMAMTIVTTRASTSSTLCCSGLTLQVFTLLHACRSANKRPCP